MATREDAIQQLSYYVAISRAEAEALVDAVGAAAAAEAFEAITAPSPASSPLLEGRVDRLARICAHLDPPRLLRTVEVAALFGLPLPQIRGFINEVRGSYPQLANEWIRGLVRSQADSPEEILDEGRPGYWRVRFKDPEALEFAYELLRREGMTKGILVNQSELVLEYPRRLADANGQMRGVASVLGL